MVECADLTLLAADAFAYERPRRDPPSSIRRPGSATLCSMVEHLTSRLYVLLPRDPHTARKELRRIGIVAGRHRQRVDHLRSHPTRWWRKTDSNHRSLSGRIPPFRLVLPAGGVEEACSEKPPSKGGTGSPNPSSSSANRRKRWQKILDLEVRRWSAMSSEDLISKLHDLRTYKVEFDSRKYQVEVELLENGENYIQIIVAVDDGSLPASLFPLTQTFIRKEFHPTT